MRTGTLEGLLWWLSLSKEERRNRELEYEERKRGKRK